MDTKELIDIISQININNPDDYDKLWDVCDDEIKNNIHHREILPYLFSFFENNLEFDFGNPGFLVSCIETFWGNGMEEELIKSLHRKPSPYTILMVNRIVNSLEDMTSKEKYFKLLVHIANNNPKIIKEAEYYLDLHNFTVSNEISKQKSSLSSPYKTINCRDFTKEEWEVYEAEEYRK